jgi:hypothetical protein
MRGRTGSADVAELPEALRLLLGKHVNLPTELLPEVAEADLMARWKLYPG